MVVGFLKCSFFVCFCLFVVEFCCWFVCCCFLLLFFVEDVRD